MPVTQTAISVGTTLVQVVAPDSMAQKVTLHNLESTASRQIWMVEVVWCKGSLFT